MGFKQGFRALMLGTAILASSHAPAAVLDNLYQVQVTPQEGQSRDDAMRDAMVVMLQRLAGSEVDLKREPVARALQTPQDFMSRIGSSEAGQLRIQFDPDALTRVLKQSGQPLLGPNRPGVVLWGIEAGELGDRALSPVAPQSLLLKQAAQHRGVALSFPLGDLQDMALVNEQVIRQASAEELLEASERYPAEGTLALIASGSDDSTELQWNLWLNDDHSSGKVSGSAAQAADELMKELAGRIFNQYAIPAASGGEHTEWRLHVEGVDGVAAYSGLLGMLRRLGTQQQPQMLEIDGDRVLLQVSFPGTEEQLERMLALDMRLQRIPEPVVEPEPLPQMDVDAQPVSAATESETPVLSASDEPLDAPAEVPLQAGPEPTLQDQPEQAQPAAPEEPPMPTLYFRWRG